MPRPTPLLDRLTSVWATLAALVLVAVAAVLVRADG